MAISPGAQASVATDIRIENPCAPASLGHPDDDLLILRTPEEILRRQIASSVRKEMQKHFERLPASMHCAWMEAFKANAAAEKLLYAQANKDREAIENEVFSDIASRLGLRTITDLYLHTDVVDSHGVVVQRSRSIEPLTDFVRRGIDFGLRKSATRNARDFIRYTRVNRFKTYSRHYGNDVDFQRVIDVLTNYDAAGRVRELLDSRFSDTASPWSTTNAIQDATRAELRFAGLEALRKGDITLEQHQRLVAAIDADRGDATSELSYAQLTLRVGRNWFIGRSPNPIRLPAFHVRLRPTRQHMETNFLYVPGHPDGSLRHLPFGTTASALLLGHVDDIATDKEHGRKLLGWLGSRLAPVDFHEVLGEIAQAGKATGQGDIPARHKRALDGRAEPEPNALTRWVAGRLQTLFAPAPGPGSAPNIAIDLYPAGERSLRFADAVEALQLSRVHSAMDPRFVGNLDADCARLEQIAMGVVEEVVSLASLPFAMRGAETLQLLTVFGMMTRQTANYLANTHASADEAAQLAADLMDFTTSLALGAGAAKVGQRPGLPVPVLYSPPGGKRKLWFDLDTYRHALSRLPAGAVRGEHGIYRKDGDLFVRLKTRQGDKVMRVVPDGAAYRIALDGGDMGPLVRPERDGVWTMSLIEQSMNSATIARLLLDDYTTDASTLARTRKIMHQFGLHERELFRLEDGEERLGANQIMLGAVGHAFVEGLAARLRDRTDRPWTPREVDVAAPAMAKHIGRPIAILDDKGHIVTAVLADGSAVSAGEMPAHALRVQRLGERYILRDAPPKDALHDYPSIFAALDAQTRPATRQAIDAAESEARFRTALADSIAMNTTRPLLERMHDRWLDMPSMPAPRRASFRQVSRMRHALRDPHHALTPAEERRLLSATRNLMPEAARVDIEVRDHRSRALLAVVADEVPAASRIVIEADLDAEGRRTGYYGQDSLGEARPSRRVEEPFSPLIDATLNAGRGEVRRALNMHEYQWGDFADRLSQRIAAEANATPPLPASAVSHEDALASLHTWLRHDDDTRPLLDDWDFDLDLLDG